MSLIKPTVTGAPRGPQQSAASSRADAAGVLGTSTTHLNGQQLTIEWRTSGPGTRAFAEALQANPTKSGPQGGGLPGSFGLLATARSTITSHTPVEAVASPALDKPAPAAWASVVAGIDWLTELHCSASCSGAIFKSVADELNLDPASRPGLAAELDQHMHQWFEQQRDLGAGPVNPEDARQEILTTIGSKSGFH